MKQYGQYCPVAKATEVLGERWTILVLREVLWGDGRFSDIARGVSKMSPSLLTRRLRELEAGGLVQRVTEDGDTRYRPTQACRELVPAMEQIALWGQRWMHEVRTEDLDPAMLMLDVGRDVSNRPQDTSGRPATVHLTLDEVPAKYREWWLVFDQDGLDVCDVDPRSEVRAWMSTDIATFTRVWLGEIDWKDAVRSERVRLDGDRQVCRAVPDWLGVSIFAAVEHAPYSLPRRGDSPTLLP